MKSPKKVNKKKSLTASHGVNGNNILMRSTDFSPKKSVRKEELPLTRQELLEKLGTRIWRNGTYGAPGHYVYSLSFDKLVDFLLSYHLKKGKR